MICCQEKEEAVRLEQQQKQKQLMLLKEEEEVKKMNARSYHQVEAQRKVKSVGLFTLEENIDVDKSDDYVEEVEREKEAVDDEIVSSLQCLEIDCNDNEGEEEEDDEEEEEIVISRPTAAASRRQILDDSSDSNNTSSDSEQDCDDNNMDDDQDFIMIDEEAIVFDKEDDGSIVLTTNDDGIESKEEETMKDDVLDGRFADLNIFDDDYGGDYGDVSDVSFGQNNQFDDDSFIDERQEVQQDFNDEDSLATENLIQTTDDDSILLSFEGCGCWSLDNETGDLYLSSTTDNDNSDPNNKKKKAKWPKIRLPLTLYKKLYQHQRIGVQWMASLYHNEIKGGLLAGKYSWIAHLLLLYVHY